MFFRCKFPLKIFQDGHYAFSRQFHMKADGMKRDTAIFLYGTYSFGMNIFFALMEFLPHPMRVMIFGFAFKSMGKSTLIDYKTYFRYPRKISIGDNVAINRGCEFYASGKIKDGTITIGNDVTLAPNVKIHAAGHDYHTLDLADVAKAVVIEDRVWVGANAVILQGVTIGKGAVIGAGSVVTKNIPAFSVAVGNPARVIKERRLVGDMGK